MSVYYQSYINFKVASLEFYLTNKNTIEPVNGDPHVKTILNSAASRMPLTKCFNYLTITKP